MRDFLAERDTGVEPASPPWKGGILPLYESRVGETGVAPAASRSQTERSTDELLPVFLEVGKEGVEPSLGVTPTGF